MWGRAQLTDTILNQGKRRTRLIFARVSSHLEQRFRPFEHASSSRPDSSQMRAKGMRCCRSLSKLEVSEAMKLVICHSVPRHPASSTASPSVAWLSSWIKCRLIRRPAAPLTALSIVSPTAVTDYSFVRWRLEAGPWFDQPLRAQRDGDSTAPMHYSLQDRFTRVTLELKGHVDACQRLRRDALRGLTR